MNKSSHCALCGTSSESASLLGGAGGYVCYTCLGQAFSTVAASYGTPRSPADVRNPPAATKRCFVCDQPVTAGNLVAFRHPFCFCGDCLRQAFEMCTERGKDPFAVVAF